MKETMIERRKEGIKKYKSKEKKDKEEEICNKLNNEFVKK
jgi:hypothetical protein